MKKLIEIDDEKQAVVPRELLEAAIEYMEYKHSGDPWEEDARAMGEMWLDVLKSVRGCPAGNAAYCAGGDRYRSAT